MTNYCETLAEILPIDTQKALVDFFQQKRTGSFTFHAKEGVPEKIEQNIWERIPK